MKLLWINNTLTVRFVRTQVWQKTQTKSSVSREQKIARFFNNKLILPLVSSSFFFQFFFPKQINVKYLNHCSVFFNIQKQYLKQITIFWNKIKILNQKKRNINSTVQHCVLDTTRRIWTALVDSIQSNKIFHRWFVNYAIFFCAATAAVVVVAVLYIRRFIKCKYVARGKWYSKWVARRCVSVLWPPWKWWARF